MRKRKEIIKTHIGLIKGDTLLREKSDPPFNGEGITPEIAKKIAPAKKKSRW